MPILPLAAVSACPDPLARAPRAVAAGGSLHERIIPAPPALQGAIVAVIFRDTRGLLLNDSQRISHFPASPLVCLSWYQGVEAGLVAQDGNHPRWRPFGDGVMVSGSQSRPNVSWGPTTGRGGMICLTADVARTLLGIDPAAVLDRFVPAHQVMERDAWPLCDALVAAPDDEATLAALQRHLAPRWQALNGRSANAPSLRQTGRHWVERLTWQARDWSRTHSLRQVERRIKSYSGRSLRDWRSLTQTEGAFFAARARHEAGQPFDWAMLALDEGFADQSHLVRSSRRITGFTPGEFAERFVQDESFWMYRLWV